MSFAARVTIRNAPLMSVLRQFKNKSGHVDVMLKRWGAIYLAAMRRRFNRFSRGGGSWPPLAASTIRSRRRGKKSRGAAGKAAILVDTGTLRNSLDPGRPGQTFRKTARGIQVSIGGPAKHPGAKGLSIGELAMIHHTGAGNVPRRTIIAPPDDATIRQMLRAAQVAIKQASGN